MRKLKWLAALPLALAVVVGPAPASEASGHGTHWIGAWADSPSDASKGSALPDRVDASGTAKTAVDDETIRSILTPTYGGSTIRIRFSNRFATNSVRFADVTIATQAAGASLKGQLTQVTFRGKPGVTLGPGKDALSDPVKFALHPFRTVAVNLFVANAVGLPSEHFTARQTSYLTAPGSGDFARDKGSGPFTQHTTTRPYVDGIDALAPRSAGAVVAFGDSITDGYQAGAEGVPENAATLNTNGRWPDDLARRLQGAHVPLSVLNEGITGNDVLGYSSDDVYGPPALLRIRSDILDQAGVTTVIWLEGINDIAQAASAARLEAGYRRGIAEMHRSGLRVLLGTLTPCGSATGEWSHYASSEVNAVREQVNTWIRHDSPADGVVDFDAAVRDRNDPSEIDPAYNGGDGLHFNLAGYRAMANAVKLSLLRHG